MSVRSAIEWIGIGFAYLLLVARILSPDSLVIVTASSVALVLLVLGGGRLVWRALLARGARRGVAELPFVLAALAFVAALVSWARLGPVVDLLLIGLTLLGVVGLALLWLRADSAVQLLGGPREEWLLLRERAALYFDVPPDSGDTTRSLVDRRVATMRSLGTTETAAYIDLIAAYYEASPEDRVAMEPDWLPRVRTLESAMLRSLRVRPAWYDSMPWLTSPSRRESPS
jgi:hypothetical protein